jgi:hypothetical protein
MVVSLTTAKFKPLLSVSGFALPYAANIVIFVDARIRSHYIASIVAI